MIFTKSLLLPLARLSFVRWFMLRFFKRSLTILGFPVVLRGEKTPCATYIQTFRFETPEQRKASLALSPDFPVKQNPQLSKREISYISNVFPLIPEKPPAKLELSRITRGFPNVRVEEIQRILDQEI